MTQSTTEGQGFVQRWFPGWWSGYSGSPVSEEHQPWDNPNQGVAAPTAVDEEELLDELGLDKDAGNQLIRDRMFATVSFHLDKGMLQLVSHDSSNNSFGPEPILELEVWLDLQAITHWVISLLGDGLCQWSF